jgi:hypothetical protein
MEVYLWGIIQLLLKDKDYGIMLMINHLKEGNWMGNKHIFYSTRKNNDYLL